MLDLMNLVVMFVNALPDVVRFSVCDAPDFVSTLVDAGYTVFEDCSMLPPK